ncbi:helix-turn-helix domain-containing protein [Senegalia sp. (in: firmicutes)]|uniref:helix-turn-helix domain-containing protein n=1 Tax=Senegalia sp. (in: firmicutes) TaxID=1924098 RepID=UPI003F9B764D
MEDKKYINQVYFENIGKRYFREMINRPTRISYEVNDDIGSGSINRVILNKGLEFTYNENFTAHSQMLDKEIENKKFFEISYCMEGEGILNLLTSNEKIEMKKGQLNFHTNKNICDEEGYIFDMKNYTGVGICLDNDILRKQFFPGCEDCMIKEWEKDLDFIFGEANSYSIEAPQCIVWDIKCLLSYDYEFKNISTLLLCQSKLMEIISKSVNYAINKRKIINLNSGDRDYIIKAKNILTQNIISPPTIEELSKECNVNTYKLKKGFKELFDDTPMGYLREIRMNKGKYLLENTEESISNIASIVGYQNPSKFSQAFKVNFNMTPSEYRKVNRNI